ncbi:MAG: hypothetical protein ABI875_00740 [Gemmatimonadales bacterium]
MPARWCRLKATINACVTSAAKLLSRRIVTGLMGRGASPLQATVWAVYAHGAAGKVLAKKIARVGFLARELLDEAPAVLEAD